MQNPDTYSRFDQQMMSLALSLAKKGRFTTSPNPNVGCVLVNQQQIVGQGWHQKAGSPHAEIHALQQAKHLALGSTAYVTFEPCSHHGRTGPCADALIQAGVKRVVAAMIDPNPQVAGDGLERLRQAGLEVSHGLLAQQAKQINRGFIQRMRSGKPWLTLKLASSLDGKTALANGNSQWITGAAARQDVQRHRAVSCAILSGSGTVLADNPSLNVRYQELGHLCKLIDEQQIRQPARVILDGRNQLNDNLKTFDLPGSVHVFNRSHNPLLRAKVNQHQVATQGNKLDLDAVMHSLGQLGFNSVWVEAGGTLAGALLQQNCVDELILYQAPKLLGDKAQNLFVMPEITQLNQAKKVKIESVRQVGEDIKITALLGSDDSESV